MRGEGKDAKYTLLDYMKSETLERPGDPNITEITACTIYRPRPCLLGLHSWSQVDLWKTWLKKNCR